MRNTIIIIAWAIICSFIIWLSFYSVQINKQNSIERQKKMEIDLKKAELDYQKQLKEDNEYLLNNCLQNALNEMNKYVELNGTKNDDWFIWLSSKQSDTAYKIKEDAQELCFKKYK